MADPGKSRAAYMRNYRKIKRHQKNLEDESHELIEGHPYLEEVVDVADIGDASCTFTTRRGNMLL